MRLVPVVTEVLRPLTPGDLRDTDTQKLREGGWKDEEIFEASFITALFAFFNRMAAAYGLDYPRGGYLPPESRPAAPR